MDEYGFFIYWKSEGSEGEVKELSQVNDIRGGEMPKVIYQNMNRQLIMTFRKGSASTNNPEAETWR